MYKVLSHAEELAGAKANVERLKQAIRDFDPNTPLGQSWPLEQRKLSLTAAVAFLENCQTPEGPWY